MKDTGTLLCDQLRISLNADIHGDTNVQNIFQDEQNTANEI